MNFIGGVWQWLLMQNSGMPKEVAALLGPRGVGLPKMKINVQLDLALFWSLANTWEWRSYINNLDRTMEAVTAAGMQPILSVGSVPKEASEGRPAYQTGHWGLIVHRGDQSKPDDPQYIQAHLAGSCGDHGFENGQVGPFCELCAGDLKWKAELADNLPSIAPSFMFTAGQMLEDRYGGMNPIYAVGNEYAIDQFWPWTRLANLGRIAHEESSDKFVKWMWLPFVQGVKSRRVTAQIAGPDAAYASDLKIMLDAMRRNASAINMLDFTSFHRYLSDDALDILNSQVSVVALNSVPHQRSWLTETGCRTDADVQFVKTIHEQFPQIDGCFLFEAADHLVQDVAGTYVITPIGRAWQSFIGTLKLTPASFLSEVEEIGRRADELHALADALVQMLRAIEENTK